MIEEYLTLDEFSGLHTTGTYRGAREEQSPRGTSDYPITGNVALEKELDAVGLEPVYPRGFHLETIHSEPPRYIKRILGIKEVLSLFKKEAKDPSLLERLYDNLDFLHIELRSPVLEAAIVGPLEKDKTNVVYVFSLLNERGKKVLRFIDDHGRKFFEDRPHTRTAISEADWEISSRFKL